MLRPFAAFYRHSHSHSFRFVSFPHMESLEVLQCLQHVECKNKAVHERTVKALELCQYLVKTVHTQKVEVNLDPLQDVLRSMNADGSLQKAGQLEDTYWSVMRLFGIQKPNHGNHSRRCERREEEQEEERTRRRAV
ncbi:myb-binding protein 1A-like protein [Colossoma macropomum]|uniref:myb-binding protein 1A-like protein n=1 Tax=Colossoma macropomum TaxID=42526 RepID=UPI001864D141|nr:myb-binding protein 1A-like protein [Colossoma macropomum]